MWQASYTAAIDDWLVGVRCDDVASARQIELLLGDRLTASDEPPSGYAVVTRPTTADGRTRRLGELRHGPQALLRSRYAGRLVAAAASHVLALGHARQPVLRLAYSLVARDSVGVIVPSRLLRTSGLEPLLVQAGWQFNDTPEIAVQADAAPTVSAICWSHDRSVTADQIRVRSILVADDLIGEHPSRSTLLSFLMASSPRSTLAPQAHLDLATDFARQLVVVAPRGTGPRLLADALDGAH